jgi:hypothetical protein
VTRGRSIRRILAALLMLGLTAAAGWAIPAAGAASEEAHLRPGDQVTIAALGAGCDVNEDTAGDVSVACGTPNGTDPRIGSFTDAISDRGASLVQVNAGGQPRIVKVLEQPAASGPAFDSPTRAAVSTTGPATGGTWYIGGTHIACGTTKTPIGKAIACFVFDRRAGSISGTIPTGSYGIFINRDRTELIESTAGGHPRLVVERKQPFPSGPTTHTITLGQPVTVLEADCPSACQVLSETTAIQDLEGTKAEPLAVPRAGRISEFTLSLGRPSPADQAYFDQQDGGAPAAALAVLRRTATSSGATAYQLVGNTNAVPLTTADLGGKLYVSVTPTVPVRKGDLIGVTTPTWAPVIATSPNDAGVDSRPADVCGTSQQYTTQSALTAIDDTSPFACRFSGIRILLTAKLRYVGG